MPTLTIRSGKAGEAWLRNALSADSQVPISKIIELAIQYHDTTGEYIHLGTVSLKEENPQRRPEGERKGKRYKSQCRSESRGCGRCC